MTFIVLLCAMKRRYRRGENFFFCLRDILMRFAERKIAERNICLGSDAMKYYVRLPQEGGERLRMGDGGF